MENMDIHPEAEVQASKKPSKMKAIFAAVVALVLISGGVYYFVFGQQTPSTPPSLEGKSQSTYQGLIKKDVTIYGEEEQFLGFDAFDVTQWTDVTKPALDAAGATPIEFEVTAENDGIAVVYSDVDVSFYDVFKLIDPTDQSDPTAPSTAAVAITYYDTATEKYIITENSYYVNPLSITQIPAFDTAGDFDDTDMDAAIIPAGQLFYIIISKDADIYLNDAGTEPANSTDFCSHSDEGWYNGVVIDFADIDCWDNVETFWLIDNSGDFTEISDVITRDRADYSDNYAVWIEFDVAPDTVTTVTECDTGTGCSTAGFCAFGYTPSANGSTCDAIVVTPTECTDTDIPPASDMDGCGENGECLAGFLAAGDNLTCDADITGPSVIGDLTLVSTTNTSVTFDWTPPTDNQKSGKASTYRVFYSPGDTWDEPNKIPVATGIPTPSLQEPGVRDSVTVSGFSVGDVNTFTVEAFDDADNSTIASPPLMIVMSDTVAPDPINLSVNNVDENSIILVWEPTGDDGDTGTADHIVVKYSTTPIDNTASEIDKEIWWAAATEPVAGDLMFIPLTPTAAVQAGNPNVYDTVIINNLTWDTEYYIAVQAVDDEDIASDISNIVTDTTHECGESEGCSVTGACVLIDFYQSVPAGDGTCEPPTVTEFGIYIDTDRDRAILTWIMPEDFSPDLRLNWVEELITGDRSVEEVWWTSEDSILLDVVEGSGFHAQHFEGGGERIEVSLSEIPSESYYFAVKIYVEDHESRLVAPTPANEVPSWADHPPNE